MLSNDPLATGAPAAASPGDARQRGEPAAHGEPVAHGEAAPHGASPPSAAAPTGESAPEPDRQAALRVLRNLEATEARLERNAQRETEAARGKLVQELLPVLDNLDRSIRAAQTGRSDPALLEGVRLVRHQLEGVLRGFGVERIDALGQRFDPALHEAIGVTAVGEPQRHGVVIHQAEPGYRFAGKLLRPAKVSVGKLVAPPLARPLWR